MDMNLSFSVLTANIISILLIGTLYLANRQKAEYNRDMRLLQQMMVTIGIANISDCCVYYLTGSSNIVIKVLVFLSGSGLFLGNVMIGYLWAKFIMVHMNIPFSDIRRNIYRTIGLISIVLLVINIFYPLVFSVSDGRYQRGFVLSATQNAKSGKPRDKPKLSGINQHKADCYAVCCVSQVVYPARYSKVSCQKNRCVFASIFLYLLKRRSVLNNRFKLF